MNGEKSIGLSRKEQARINRAKVIGGRILLKLLKENDDDMVVVMGALCMALRICIDTQHVLDREAAIMMVANLIRSDFEIPL